MPELPAFCPSCRGALAVERLKCAECGTQLDGGFELPPLLRLSPADMEFVLRFVQTSGSLKAMAKEYGQSYPTIRNRLDAIIAQLGDAEPAAARERHAILDKIAKGKLSIAAAERQLRRLLR